ncbi:MAG: MFS transporter [Sphaerobacter sp.]|nr:MFS transporter [Sphaerobacter sp.]
MKRPWVLQHPTLRIVIGLTALAGTAVGLVIPFLTLAARDRGVSLEAIGVMASSYLVAQMLLQLPMGALSDRVGRAVPIALGMVVEAGATVGYTVADSAWSFILLRIIQGVGLALLYPALRALIADVTPEERRGQAYAGFGAAYTTGLLFAPLVGGIVAETVGVNALFLSAAAIELLVAIGGIVLLREVAGPRPRIAAAEATAIPFRALLVGPLIGAFILSFASQFQMGLFAGIWSIYMDDLGASDIELGLSYSTFSIAYLLVAPIGGRLADAGARWRRLLVANLAIGAVIVSYGVIPSVLAILLLGFVEGAIATVQQPSLDAYLASVSDPRVMGRVQGAFSTVGMTGAAMSALLGPVLYGVAPVVPFLTGGVVLCLLTLVAVLRFIRPVEQAAQRARAVPAGTAEVEAAEVR